MAIQYSTTLRNNQLDQIGRTIGMAPKLQIRTGPAPATCAAANSGALLVEITLPPDWMAPASNGTKAQAGAWRGTATGTGTAGHYRIFDGSGAVCHMQGTCGLGSGDLDMDNTSIASGQAVSISSFQVSIGNA